MPTLVLPSLCVLTAQASTPTRVRHLSLSRLSPHGHAIARVAAVRMGRTATQGSTGATSRRPLLRHSVRLLPTGLLPLLHPAAAAGLYTCSQGGRDFKIPGSYGHYEQDAATFASWGVRYVKMDW
jgi:hypothetical protein